MRFPSQRLGVSRLQLEKFQETSKNDFTILVTHHYHVIFHFFNEIAGPAEEAEERNNEEASQRCRIRRMLRHLEEPLQRFMPDVDKCAVTDPDSAI